MPEIFLVNMTDGQWSDHYSTPIRAWSVKDKADAHVAELEKEQTIYNSVVDLVLKLSEHYDANTPAFRPFDTNKLKKEPKWNGLRSNQITDIMRSERDRIREHNSLLYQEYGRQRGEWESKKHKAVHDQLIQNRVPEELVKLYDETGYLSHKTCGYSVEPLELD